MLPHFHLICTKHLYHHMHKIDPIVFILIHNKITHHHILLIHNSHHLLILMSHHHISHNTRQLLVHLHIVVILQSYWLYKSNGNTKKTRYGAQPDGKQRKKKEKKRMKEEREQRKEDRKQMKKCENQQRSRINKAFKKIPRFDGTNPSYCFDWLEQTEALVNEHHGRIYREELLLNCGTSMSKTIHALPQGVTNQIIKDAVLRNHSKSQDCITEIKCIPATAPEAR